MALLRLADHVVFDAADGAGVILDTARGVYIGLNPTATLMLEAGLRCDTMDELLADLRRRVDGSDDVLRQGVAALSTQLTEHRLTADEEVGRR
jgi:hypothetical protein